MNSYRVRHATSAGGLVYDDREDGRWVVLIAHKGINGDIQWTLPKGGIDEDETLVQTAVREVREETGLDAEVRAKLGVVDYWFVWRPDKVRFHKYVHYFMLEFVGGDFSQRDHEAEDVVWLPIDEAISKMSHTNESRVVRKAIEVYGKKVGASPPIPPTLRPIVGPSGTVVGTERLEHTELPAYEQAHPYAAHSTDGAHGEGLAGSRAGKGKAAGDMSAEAAHGGGAGEMGADMGADMGAAMPTALGGRVAGLGVISMQDLGRSRGGRMVRGHGDGPSGRGRLRRKPTIGR